MASSRYIDPERPRKRRVHRQGYRLLALSQEVHDCDRCGKTDLLGTVLVKGPDGKQLHLGSDCAARVLGWHDADAIRYRFAKRAEGLEDEAPAGPLEAEDEPVEPLRTIGNGRRPFQPRLGESERELLARLKAESDFYYESTGLPFPDPGVGPPGGLSSWDESLDTLEESLYFASGSNTPGDIRGVVGSGTNVGVAVDVLSQNAIAELQRLAGLSTMVFVDSGAFGEVDKKDPRRIIKPISDEEWDKRLDVYEEIAQGDGTLQWRRDQLYFVAPDCVAHQAETLRRLRRFAPRVRHFMGMGANMIVPVQKGEKTMPEFAAEAAKIIGTDQVIWGIPMKKDATSVEELRDFVAAMHRRYKGRPFRLHLLGTSSRVKQKHLVEKFRALIATIKREAPEAVVFSDSVFIMGQVSRARVDKTGRQRQTGALTAAQDEMRARGLTGFDVKHAATVKVFRDQEQEKIARTGWTDPELQPGPPAPTVACDVGITPVGDGAWVQLPSGEVKALRLGKPAQLATMTWIAQRQKAQHDAGGDIYKVPFTAAELNEIERVGDTMDAAAQARVA